MSFLSKIFKLVVLFYSLRLNLELWAQNSNSNPKSAIHSATFKKVKEGLWAYGLDFKPAERANMAIEETNNEIINQFLMPSLNTSNSFNPSNTLNDSNEIK